MREMRGDRGQAAVQFAGFFPIVLMIILLCFKIFTTMNTAEQVDNAARNGARAASADHTLAACPEKAMAALPAWLKEMENPQDHLDDDRNRRVRVTVSGNPIGQISCRVEAKIPVLWSGVPFDITVDRTVHMPG